MKIDDALKLSIIIAILLISFAFIYYFVFFLPSQSTIQPIVDIPGNTLKCNELYEIKKSKYWNEWETGQDKAIYNQELNTCLAMNIHNDADSGEYFAMVIDMSDDKTLMYYSDNRGKSYIKAFDCNQAMINFDFLKDGKKIEEEGCERFELMDEMFKIIRSYGFKVNDGFSSE